MAPKPRPPIERFSEKIRLLDDGCIEWTAYRGENGYGRFYVDGRGALAHRWSYEYWVGSIPAGLHLDHLCRNRACVNPDHLEPVSQSENVRRGIGPLMASERHSAVTHCPEGHLYDEANTYTGGRGRTCLTCKRQKARDWYLRNRELTIQRARLRREKQKAEAA
jgi:hypothetical protein